ncbi:MAG: hypothetical protein ACI9WU_002956 [Myxococcota bacterium]|jgi:hypothetical protein
MLSPVPLRLLAVAIAGALSIGCASDAVDVPVESGGGYPTEAAIFERLPQGDAQRIAVCDRLIAGNVESQVRSVFCSGAAHGITNLTDLLSALGLTFDGPDGRHSQRAGGDNGNPNWALIGHSAALSRRTVSPVNPRAIIHTPAGSHLDAEPGFVVAAYVRGEELVEIITHDASRDDLNFFLVRFQLPCRTRGDCTDADLYGDGVEQGWESITLYDEKDVENTVLECSVCHVHGQRREGPRRKSLLMFQLNSMWRHWLYDPGSFDGWISNPQGPGPFLEMLDQFVQARGTDDQPLGGQYAGIPGDRAYASRPLSLESLMEGNGYGNGFDYNAYTEDGRGVGLFEKTPWPVLDALNRTGWLIAPPAQDTIPVAGNKLAKLITGYRAFQRGEVDQPPDMADLWDPASLHKVGLGIDPSASPAEVLVQACTQCHHYGLDQSLSRARFQTVLTRLELKTLQEARRRLLLPADHLEAMPPLRTRHLTGAQRGALVAWFDQIIVGAETADDGQPPTPTKAEFALAPVWLDMGYIQLRAVDGQDPRGLVLYRFEDVTGALEPAVSEWQLGPYFLVRNAQVEHPYTFRVQMRDWAGNEGEWSEAAEVQLPEGVDVNTDECAGLSGGRGLPQSEDQDCDSLSNEEEGKIDTDNDGVPNFQDPDDDGDTLPTITERADGLKYGADLDGDGVPVWLDTDSDGDGILDENESGDYDDDSIPDYLDPE